MQATPLFVRSTFWLIQQMKRAKAQQDADASAAAASGKQVVSHA